MEHDALRADMTTPSGILQQSVMSGPRIHIMVVKKSKAIEKTQRGVLANNCQRSKTCAYTVASVFPSVGSAALQTLVSYEDHSTRAESRGPSRARSSARSSVTRKTFLFGSSRWSRNSRCRWLEALSASNAAAASTNTAWPHSNGWLQLIRNSQSLNNVRIPPVPSEPQAQREQQNNRATLLVHQGELSAAMAHTRLLRTCLRHRTGDTSPLSKKLACPGRLLSKRLCMHRRSFLREQCMHRCILSPFSETLQTKAVEAGPSSTRTT